MSLPFSAIFILSSRENTTIEREESYAQIIKEPGVLRECSELLPNPQTSIIFLSHSDSANGEFEKCNNESI